MDKEKDIVEIDLQEIFTFLLYKCWIIIVAMVVCASIAFTYTKIEVVPQYSSDAMLFVNASSSIAGMDVSFSVDGINTGKNVIGTYKVILKTRDTLGDIIDYVGCDYTIEQLSGKISVAAVQETSVMQIAVSDPDPVMAEKIATAITKILPEKISSIVDGTAVKIVDTAIVPSAPYSPDYRKNTMMGALIGAILSIGALLVIKLSDKKITSVDYVKSHYEDIPLLGVIPFVETTQTRQKNS